MWVGEGGREGGKGRGERRGGKGEGGEEKGEGKGREKVEGEGEGKGGGKKGRGRGGERGKGERRKVEKLCKAPRLHVMSGDSRTWVYLSLNSLNYYLHSRRVHVAISTMSDRLCKCNFNNEQ